MSDTSLDAVIAEIIAQWRTENPTAHQIPRTVRKELSRAVREDSQLQRMDTEIARSQIGLEILHHQRDMAAASRRAPGQGEAEWAATQQRLAASAEALERHIHSVHGLNAEDRGSAVAALRRAHRDPSPTAPHRVEWAPVAGRPSLAARVVERISAIRLGFAVATRGVKSPMFVAAQAEATQRTAEPAAQSGTPDWLTPAQSAAVADLTAAAQRYETTSELARNGESAYLAVALDDFNGALERARQIGIPSQRLDHELAEVHRRAMAPAAPAAQFARMTQRVRAAAGPLTPPPRATTPASTTQTGVPVPAAAAGQTHIPRRTR